MSSCLYYQLRTFLRSKGFRPVLGGSGSGPSCRTPHLLPRWKASEQRTQPHLVRRHGAPPAPLVRLQHRMPALRYGSTLISRTAADGDTASLVPRIKRAQAVLVARFHAAVPPASLLKYVLCLHAMKLFAYTKIYGSGTPASAGRGLRISSSCLHAGRQQLCPRAASCSSYPIPASHDPTRAELVRPLQKWRRRCFMARPHQERQ